MGKSTSTSMISAAKLHFWILGGSKKAVLHFSPWRVSTKLT
jgi:hypothetical protein